MSGPGPLRTHQTSTLTLTFLSSYIKSHCIYLSLTTSFILTAMCCPVVLHCPSHSSHHYHPVTYSECLLSEVLLLLLCCLLLLLLLLLLLCQHLIGPHAWMDALACHVTETVHDRILLEGLVGKPEVYRAGRKRYECR